MKNLRQDIVTRIEKDYEEKTKLFGLVRDEIEKKVGAEQGLTKILCKFIYAYLPLSDAADYDFDILKSYAEHSAYLYENSEYLKDVPDEYFLNYVVAPRINSEDLTDCRSFFYKMVKDRIKGMNTFDAVLELNNWCYENVTYRSTSERTASPITAYKGGYGRCGEESTFFTTILRSVGIPARQVYVPRWSHSDSNHAWCEIWVNGEWLFTGACEPKPIYNSGWFPYAASRAMVAHSIVFSPFTYEKVDETITKDGAATVINNGFNYCHQKEITVKVVDENNKPVENARVQFEIINSSEFFPLVSLWTDKKGEGKVKLGFGTIHVYAVYEEKRFEGFYFVPDTDVINITLSKEEFSKDWELYTIHAPESATIKGVEVTKEQDDAQNAKNAKGDVIRNSRVDGYYEEDFANKYKEYTQIGRVLKSAKGNFEEIKKFILLDIKGITLEHKNRLLATLTQKDCRDVKAEVLAEHVLAYLDEDKICKNLTIPEEYKKMLMDAESKQGQEDMTAEFYHACPDFFSEYVASPRINIERLTCYRSEIKKLFGNENPFKTPEEIWDYIVKNITYYEDKEYTTIMATPGSTLKLKAGTMRAQNILFVAICRTYGIPADMDMMYKKAKYFNGKEFIFADTALRESATLHLHFLDKELPECYSQFTLEVEEENGEFTSLDYMDFFMNMTRDMDIELIPGTYRIVTCNRTMSGSVMGRKFMFNLKAGEKISLELTCKEKQDLLAKKISIPEMDFTKAYKDTKLHAFFFLKTNNEPTEHVLNELIEMKNMGHELGCPIHFVIKKEEEKKDATFAKILERFSYDLLFDETGEKCESLAKATNTKLESYPYICLMENDTDVIFADCGYRVGIVDMLSRIVEEVNSTEE